MTQEDKDLLLKDLCARLPYKLVCEVKFSEYGKYKTSNMFLDGVFNDEAYFTSKEGSIYSNDYKPYLFPLSSMTEEQSIELFKLFEINLKDSISTDYIKINECTGITFFLDKGFDVETHLDKLINWFHKNHFDYRGLIPMGLANDATGLNIY